MSAHGDTIRELASLPPDATTVQEPIENGRIYAQVPFSEAPYRAFAKDGSRVVLGLTSITSATRGILRIVVVGVRGDTIVTRDVPFTPIPVTRRMSDSAAADAVSMHRPDSSNKDGPVAPTRAVNALESAVREAMPKFASPYRGIMLGADHSIWLILARDGPLRKYLLLDQQGNTRGQVTTPSEKTSIGWYSTLDMVWTVESAADDIPSLVRYKIVW
jgi:hypothetical protein